MPKNTNKLIKKPEKQLHKTNPLPFFAIVPKPQRSDLASPRRHSRLPEFQSSSQSAVHSGDGETVTPAVYSGGGEMVTPAVQSSGEEPSVQLIRRIWGVLCRYVSVTQ
ncbi:unnamed protein product [Linum tenue]|uniref:Uncharacterized protein n=1 Tax=Linum tenue TaxID=586396 RepID=A0AAV0Q6L0_9ROSI|nr:unnamed protein product [Linum tenue]